MNDQWKQFVADAYDAFGDCAPATPVRRFLRLIDAQDAVVKAARKLVSNCLSGSMKRDAITDCERALIELAELKLE